MLNLSKRKYFLSWMKAWWIFYFTKFVQSKVVECIFHWSEFIELFWCQIFLSGKAGQGVLNMDPMVGIDGVRPTNTCIPPSFPIMCRCSSNSCGALPPQKYCCKYRMNYQNSETWLSYKKQKSEKTFDKLIFGNNEPAKCRIWHFHLSCQLGICFFIHKIKSFPK